MNKEAQKHKQQSIEISQLVDKQTKYITIKKGEVQKDLEQIRPAVIEVQNAVKSIKKQHLVEVRSMANLPPLIKMALESVCILLGEGSRSDWKGIRAVTMKEDFVPSIVHFNTNNITDDIRKTLAKDYLSNPEYSYYWIYQANVACGSMVKGAITKLEYAEKTEEDLPAILVQTKEEEEDEEITDIYAEVEELKDRERREARDQGLTASGLEFFSLGPPLT